MKKQFIYIHNITNNLKFKVKSYLDFHLRTFYTIEQLTGDVNSANWCSVVV